MAQTANVFESFVDQALQGNINWPSDTIKMGLLTGSASPSLSSWVHWSDVTNEVTGTGYTAGGTTLTSPTHTPTAANSWGTSRANSTPYVVGNIVKPATGNGFLYVCVVAGTSGSSVPTYTTVVGNTLTDGGVTWSCLGESVTVWSSAAASWTSSTITADYGIIYKSTGTASTSPLIAVQAFGGDEISSSGSFTVTPDPTNGWFISAPA